MQDEYGEMTNKGESYFAVGRFHLESGAYLERPEVRYNCSGTLNDAKDNVLVVCHPLTGNSDLHSWWGGLVGPGRAFDTDKYYVVCANILGSCYGSTGPMSVKPQTGRPYMSDFPKVTVRDSVRLHLEMVKEGIGASGVAAVVGGSLGGMQALEWALLGEDFVRCVVPMACGASHTAWQIGTSEAQRQAIYTDPKWCGGKYDPADPPTSGLSVARMMAMISYRTPKSFQSKFGRKVNAKKGIFETRSYLEYQGKQFLSRMDPMSYIAITEQMDTHDVGAAGRGGIDAALASLRQPALIIGIDSDMLYPLHEQQELAEKIPGAEFSLIRSDDGHDAFLLAQEQVQAAISAFLKKQAA